MIQSFADKYKKHIAYTLFAVFYLQTILLPYSAVANNNGRAGSYYGGGNYRANKKTVKPAGTANNNVVYNNSKTIAKATKINLAANNTTRSPKKTDIGGPSSPEATSFKAVGSDNLVNLATGDFSYSIPLLDVGGYPVNLFYTGGITMEQEASWVGLGWNINPGTVSRNMRGVPDDFNGTDLLTQEQNVKPNRTWGGDLGLDVEYVGLKGIGVGIGGSLGFSYNNYLGPALEVGARVSLSITASKNVEAEKSAPASLGLTAKLGAKLSSRSGMTFSPSLSANGNLTDNKASVGIGLSTSYNSRTGIKELTLSSSTNFSLKGNTTMGSILQSEVMGGLHQGKTISFAKPSYIPTLRMPMQNVNYSGQLELGAAFWGIKVGESVLGYYSESKVPLESRKVTKPLVGYMYSEKANENENAVMDFNRLNDAEVTPNTPVISAPQYNYDVFSIQGEGTGGSIRAYRGDLGFVRDNVTTSKEKNVSAGIDFGVPFHIGMNVNVIKTPTRVGGWEDGNNTLLQSMAFKTKNAANTSSFENVYFRNPGEATVTNEEVMNRIGRDNLVRFKLGGSGESPRIESQLEQFSKITSLVNGNPVSIANKNLVNREKRTQVITMLTAADASSIGLEKQIRNYREGANAFDANSNITFVNFPRVDEIRKPHHISEINVLEQSGMRYVYGLPVYSLKQKDFTFSVNALPANAIDNLVGYSDKEPTPESEHMENKAKLDGYVQSQETPAYASSFLLTGLLSPDYVDVTGDGITEDDLGGAVKFDYTKSNNHKWRTPRSNSEAKTAHFNEGIRTEKKDNKATISYGERETWYLNAIESKSMVAIFKTDARNDAKGVVSEMDGKLNTGEDANKKLAQIDLYTKAEIKAKGYANARPIKTVKFDYDYSLCNGSPDNNAGGKLTLKAVYFSYNGQVRNNKDRYVFNYGSTNYKKDNPNYSYNASDRWGTYKPAKDSTGADNNKAGLTNADFPYTINDKSKNDIYAGAWSLKKILLPSGGQMEMQYEADDYAYVQDRRACNMINIYGLGKTANYNTNDGMYNNGLFSQDNYYLYIKLDQPLVSTTPTNIKNEIYAKYLDGVNKPGEHKLVCKIQVNMPNGPEPLTVYPEYDDYGLCANSTNKDYIYIHLVAVDGKSPLARSAIGFLTENIPGQAFEGYDVEVDGFRAFAEMAGGMLNGLKNSFSNVDLSMRTASPPKARTIDLARSFVRLANPVKNKYGGGLRVKTVRVKDNWNKMTGQYTSVYGQDYDYTTSEKTNGVETTISSGVASYEPGIGSEENPFREIVSFSNKLPLASAQYGAIEMPMLEGLYPSPNVVYSKVTVRSIHRKGTHGDSALRSAIGKQVTEFYTARDYPSYSTMTTMDALDYNKDPYFAFFNKEVIDRRALSQGFLVETNDMHGKMKSQVAYSESDEKTPLSASYHFYKNTGKNGLNDKVDFVYNNLGGAVAQGNMGIDMELMTDVREFSVKSNGFNGQLQVDLFTFAFVVVPIPTFFPFKTYVENIYRAVTCTKLINYHAIEDSVIVMDKGSVITTKTIAYDAETGTPIVTKTANEFKDPIYNVNYPAYWAYSGMGLAYKNIEREFVVDFNDGRISLTQAQQNEIFESGDELYITKKGTGVPAGSCLTESVNVTKLWAYDKNKNTTALTVPNKDLIFLDSAGNIFTKANVGVRIVRSGKRNLLGNSVASATTMANPIVNAVLNVTGSSKAVAASAIEYKEKWQTDNEVFKKYRDTLIQAICTVIQIEDCNGYLEKKINPYVKGLIGNYKGYRSMVYYGDRVQVPTTPNATKIRKDGYLATDFSMYWNFNAAYNLIPNTSNLKWVWNSESLKYNSKGLELETKDALNIYTAAQYGFNKTMPVAVAKNSRYNEMFGEGFEDYYFNEKINSGTAAGCDKKHMNFGSAINANLLGFNAHSGKSVLQVNQGTQVKNINVTANGNLDYNFNFSKDTTKTLNAPGGLFSFTSNAGSYYQQATATFNNSLFQITVYPGKLGGSFHYYNFTDTTYIQIMSQATYNFSISLSTQYLYTASPSNSSNGFNVSIYDLNNNLINSTGISKNILPVSNSLMYSVALCPGFYRIVGGGSESAFLSPPDDGINTYTWSCSNFQLPKYQSLTTVNGCISTLPIRATDSMLNPVFNLVPNKKMQFSAWVREDCPVPCPKLDYAYSNIEMWANGAAIPGSTIKRTGAIIEGWQKIEGEFTVPANATTAEIHFINGNTAPMYVDDIRIHPFNANMKTYAYDPRTLRLAAELDENNYATFYEYDEEGQLVRVKKETSQGIKTINETRAAKQKTIIDVVE
jgi:hypothetical protein